MKVEPYISPQIRAKQAWQEIADFLGVHPVVARLAWMNYFCGMELKTWMKMVLDGSLKKEKLDLTNPLTKEELEEKQKSYEEATVEQEFTDILDYRLKQLVEIGDEIVCDEDKFYFSGPQYLTRGKRYKIREFKDEGLTSFCAITSTDINGESNYVSNHGIRSLWRNGEEIWNWSLAYLELFIEQNPSHPQTEELRKSSLKNAHYHRTGEERPCEYTINRHKEGMKDSVYAAGYNSSEDDDNPYEFPRELSDERSYISLKRHLTEKDKEKLKKYNKLIDESEWSRWSWGKHFKKYSYLK